MNEKRAYAALGLLAGICAALTALMSTPSRRLRRSRRRAPSRRTKSAAFTRTRSRAKLTLGSVDDHRADRAGRQQPGGPVKPPAISTDQARTFDFSYTFELSGDALDIAGTISATLELSAGEAWSEKRDLVPPTPFQGATGSLSASLDFRQIDALLQQVNQRTGTSAEEYELVITPLVKVEGSIGGRPFEETFSTPTFDRLHEHADRPGGDARLRRAAGPSRSRSRPTERLACSAPPSRSRLYGWWPRRWR